MKLRVWILTAFLTLFALSGVSCEKKGKEAPQIVNTETGIQMVVIPSGWFQMGSTRGEADESPVHRVWVDSFLMDRYEVNQEQYEKLYAFLDEMEMSLPEAALRMVVSNPDISTVLTGARSVEEVEQNVSSVEKGPLPADVLSRLQEIADMVPFRPYEEPFGLPFGRPYKGPGHA